ncbi:prolyl endopeptidase-like [Hyperolius riggenbachi]|uniref:prolyl endopeptidase-like n=1 Tax=Hyperolius riggenbachi TaxID=752182 RepID=UPI0035A2792F
MVSFLGRWSQLRTVQRRVCSRSFIHGYTRYLYRPSRGVSTWQAQLEFEKTQWRKASVAYKNVAAAFKKRLDKIHRCSPMRSEYEMITQRDYVYFEEDNCIHRFHKTIGEESLEMLFSPGDVGLQDSLIQRIRVSPKQTFMAVAVKGFDREESDCFIVTLEGAPELASTIPNVFSFEWATDNVLFHTRLENLQSRSVHLTDFTNGSTTKLVYTEQHPRFFVDLYMTRDRRFLTINSNSKSSSEVWLSDCDRPFQPPVLVQQREPGVTYLVEHSHGYLYVLTTHGEPAEYKLMKAPVGGSVRQWKQIYQLKPHSRLLDMEIVKDHCVMFLKHNAELHMDVTSLSTESMIHSMKLPAWACAVQPAVHPEQGADQVRFSLESPVHRPAMFAYSVTEKALLVEADHPSEKSDICQVLRLKAESEDSTQVPVTIICRVGDELALRQRPLLVHVYGAYGMDLNMSFKAENRLLVEDGWILAYCHVRGGGELGCHWHKQGILGKKQNGLRDLQACINHMHRLGLSQPCYTAVMAASAGGVLAGALYNSSPELFRAMILEAPFLDVLNTMMDTSLPLTIEEQEEWGNPLHNKEHYHCIQSYCPYQNIKAQNCPSLLITAYENDQRVPLNGVLSYVRKLRTAVEQHQQSSDQPGSRTPNILLDVRPGGSHCDSLPWEESLQKVGMHLSFLHKELRLAGSELSRHDT